MSELPNEIWFSILEYPNTIPFNVNKNWYSMLRNIVLRPENLIRANTFSDRVLNSEEVEPIKTFMLKGRHTTLCRLISAILCEDLVAIPKLAKLLSINEKFSEFFAIRCTDICRNLVKHRMSLDTSRKIVALMKPLTSVKSITVDVSSYRFDTNNMERILTLISEATSVKRIVAVENLIVYIDNNLRCLPESINGNSCKLFRELPIPQHIIDKVVTSRVESGDSLLLCKASNHVIINHLFHRSKWYHKDDEIQKIMKQNKGRDWSFLWDSILVLDLNNESLMSLMNSLLTQSPFPSLRLPVNILSAKNSQVATLLLNVLLENHTSFVSKNIIGLLGCSLVSNKVLMTKKYRYMLKKITLEGIYKMMGSLEQDVVTRREFIQFLSDYKKLLSTDFLDVVLVYYPYYFSECMITFDKLKIKKSTVELMETSNPITKQVPTSRII